MNFPNEHVRIKIGLITTSPVTFDAQLIERGFTYLGYQNGIKDGSDQDLIIRGNDWTEIYNTRHGYHLIVSVKANAFYEIDSGD